MSVVGCQVQVSALACSLVQRGPTECGVSEYDREFSTMKRPWPSGGLSCHDRKSRIIEWSMINE